MTPATRSLLRAAADGDAGLVRSLLAQGTEVDCKTAANQTPLMLAAAFGHANIVRLLLAAGANIELQDEVGLSAKDWASRFPEVAQQLAGKSTPVNQSSEQRPPESVDNSNQAMTGREERQPTETVVFPKPRLTERDRLNASKQLLGGLAGAILRDRSVAPQDEAESIAISSNRPDDKPQPGRATTRFVPSILQSPTEVETDRAASQPAVPATPQGNYKLENLEVDTPLIRKRVVEETDETTISGKRGTFEPVDTPSAGRTLIPRDPVVHQGTAPSGGSTRLSKVQVAVPSFGAMAGKELGRPIRWVLVIAFLLAGATGGYFLSDYLLKRDRDQPSAPDSSAASQPTAQQAKPGPLVGGALAGAEMFLPDAEYPPELTRSQDNNNISGSVTIQAEVDQHGAVTSVKAVDGDERFRAAALAAAKKASFSPDKLKGKGRIVSGTITYNFVAPMQQLQTTNAQSSPAPVSVPSPDTSIGTSSNDQEILPKVGGALAGSELNLPRPQYPPRAKTKGITGTVTIVVRVNRTGRVVSWRTEEGDSKLRGAALAAAKKSTFSPDKLPGTGDVVGTITYTFR